LKNRFPHPEDIYKEDESEWKPCQEYDGYTDARYVGKYCRFGNSMMFPPPHDRKDPDLLQERMVGWDKTRNGQVDLRLYYANERDATAWTECRWSAKKGSPYFYYKSYSSDWHETCYSTEALKFAQSGYLVSIVCV
jgi:hypothetical protein